MQASRFKTIQFQTICVGDEKPETFIEDQHPYTAPFSLLPPILDDFKMTSTTMTASIATIPQLVVLGLLLSFLCSFVSED